MTFEEFFKKKRIDLAALDKAEPSLFSEFKADYGQMGEKSFDYSKKYWFNKLRRQFQLAPDVKTEKIQIENPLAEQTVIESLSETVSAPPSPKLGFAPKFKAANMVKPAVAEDKKDEIQSPATMENTDIEKPAETGTPKPAYKPRFSMKNIPPKEKEQE